MLWSHLSPSRYIQVDKGVCVTAAFAIEFISHIENAYKNIEKNNIGSFPLNGWILNNLHKLFLLVLKPTFHHVPNYTMPISYASASIYGVSSFVCS